MNRPGFMPKGKFGRVAPQPSAPFTAEAGGNGAVLFPKTLAEWAASYSFAAPVHGWVFDNGVGLPYSDLDVGSPVPVDQNVAGAPLYGTVFKGRGGGGCIEDSGSNVDVSTTISTGFFDCSGDFSILATYWRGPEQAITGNHVWFQKGASGSTPYFSLAERAHPTQNWILHAINDGSTSFSSVGNYTADPANFAYSTGVDTLVVRDTAGVMLNSYDWFQGPNVGVAYHENLACGAAIDFTNSTNILQFLDGNIGDALTGRQFKSLYLFEYMVTRDNADEFRGTTTTSQDEV